MNRSGNDREGWAEVHDCCHSEDMLSGFDVCSDRQKESEDGCAGVEDMSHAGVLVSSINACCCHGEL